MTARVKGIALAAIATASVSVFGVTGRAGGQEGQGGRPSPLPEGAGKAAVQANCTRCHAVNSIANTWGFTKAGWQALIGTMVVLPQDQLDVITTYLAANFPEKQIPAAKLVSGPVKVTMREWKVPTLGSRPHDGMATRDGNIWWSGTVSNKIGYINPRTNEIREYEMKTPGSGPQGMVEDAEGTIWFTMITKGLVGKLNRKTGDIVEYQMPQPGVHGGAHTPFLDQKGNFWFTLRSGHLGRLTMASGELKVVPSPSDPTYPYGLKVDSKGIPWYVDFQQNKLGSIDPVTMAIKEHTLPNAATRPRRIAITPDDAIWYTDYPRGYIGRFDQATGTVREWLSPSGPQSGPYGITSVGNVIWYTESAVKPNTLVRFDPQTEQFQSWAIQNEGLPISGVVRHMVATPNGDIHMVQSRTNRIVLAEVAR
jgi:virginiamycin B lyase